MPEKKRHPEPQLVCPTESGKKIKPCIHPSLCPHYDYCLFMLRETKKKLKPIKEDS